ncbi:cysteine hydrolase [Streptomyces sp. NBC_00285]|uniref:cysteine hydrolase family protein n=1 Tax=Streptomyces sp. NBC_00285 TaxID=2975700 RepID=UPI002E2954D1|nr:isochorismatase family cysteine hydrolase [Streptomyces sp. NBC_00285]
MPLADGTDRPETAFLALDYATHIVENYSHDPDVTDRATYALASARKAGVPIFHITHEAMRDQFHPRLGPVGDEPVLGKRTLGAFATTDLHERLQTAGIRRIILGGVATSGTVLSTTRWAYDIGYEVLVCTDACADPDPQVHAALVDESVFPASWLGLWRIARMVESNAVTGLLS